MRDRTREAVDRIIDDLDDEFDVSCISVEEYWPYTDGETDPENPRSAEIEITVAIPYEREDENPYRIQ